MGNSALPDPGGGGEDPVAITKKGVLGRPGGGEVQLLGRQGKGVCVHTGFQGEHTLMRESARVCKHTSVCLCACVRMHKHASQIPGRWGLTSRGSEGQASNKPQA